MKIRPIPLIIYVFSILAFSILALIYEQPFLLLFILLLISLLPISLLVFINVSEKYEFSFYPSSEYVEEPNSPSFVLKMDKASRLSLFTGDVFFNVQNRFYPNETLHKLSIPLSRNDNSFFIPVDTSQIGLITVNIKNITLYDYLSIFKKNIELNLEASVLVYPPETNIGDFPPAVPKDGPDEFVESENIGNISSDVKEIREYRPGDRLQRIHWKLSAKLDDLFVKEMAHTSTLSIVLLPELCEEDIHDTCATLISCIKKMYEKKERFEVCVYNDKAMDYSYFTVINEEGLNEVMTHFYCMPLYEGKDNALNAFINSTDRMATLVHIVGKKIKIGE